MPRGRRRGGLAPRAATLYNRSMSVPMLHLALVAFELGQVNEQTSGAGAASTTGAHREMGGGC
jgi:hypothetical protein